MQGFWVRSKLTCRQIAQRRPSSPKALRVHAERFARYFVREMHFGSIQFEAAEVPSSIGFVPHRAFLFAREGR